VSGPHRRVSPQLNRVTERAALSTDAMSLQGPIMMGVVCGCVKTVPRVGVTPGPVTRWTALPKTDARLLKHAFVSPSMVKMEAE
jgi:hypothetical protein